MLKSTDYSESLYQIPGAKVIDRSHERPAPGFGLVSQQMSHHLICITNG